MSSRSFFDSDARSFVSRPPLSGREAALRALWEYDRRGAFLAPVLERLFAESGLPAAERRLARELTATVVRRKLTLEALLKPHLSRPKERVERKLWTLLQLGTCQLVLMERIPVHAAVSETVALARWCGQPRWCGFLNAVLRSVAKTVTDDFTGMPDSAAVPLTHGRYRRLKGPVFPDPVTDPAGYFSRGFSFPRWLAERWQPRFETPALYDLGFWFNTPHGFTLRINRLKTTREEVLAAFAAAGISTAAGLGEWVVHIEPAGEKSRPEEWPGFKEGWWTVQDETAMFVAELLGPRPGERVLDLCAAPGTKTTHLAELMQNRGHIVATDVREEKLARIRENAGRLGLSIIEPVLVSPGGDDLPPGPFDAVLVDAPCSNTGVLGKRPEARWRISPGDIGELAGLQRRLLNLAVRRLKPNGRLVYSTCSIEPEENEGAIADLLTRRSDVLLEEQRLFLPGQPSDGGFAALLSRTSAPGS